MDKKKKIIIIILCVIIVLCVAGYIFFLNDRKVTITFISDDVIVRKIKIEKGEVMALSPLEKDGYDFDGWYYNDNNLGDSSKFDKNTTLIAKWSLKTASMIISFNTNGGNVIKKIMAKCDDLVELPKPIKKGYKFVGWFNNNLEVDSLIDLPCQDITLDAKWEKISISGNYVSSDFETALNKVGIKKTFNKYFPNEDAITIYLFYSSTCSRCHEFLEFMNSITSEYGKYFKMAAFEVYSNQDNTNLMDEVASYLDKKASGVPYIVIGNKVFRGYSNVYEADIKKAIMDLYETPLNDRADVLIDMHANE